MTQNQNVGSAPSAPVDNIFYKMPWCEVNSPAGWYLSPTDYRVLSYWDGLRWSGFLYPIPDSLIESARIKHEFKFSNFKIIVESLPKYQEVETKPVSAKIDPTLDYLEEEQSIESYGFTSFNNNESSKFTIKDTQLRQITCYSCKSTIQDNLIFCTFCGAKQSTNACLSCGEHGFEPFCIKCGTPRS